MKIIIFEKNTHLFNTQTHPQLSKHTIGLLRDLSGGYEVCFYCMGVCMVLGSVPLVVVVLQDTLAQRDDRKLSSSMERVA